MRNGGRLEVTEWKRVRRKKLMWRGGRGMRWQAGMYLLHVDFSKCKRERRGIAASYHESSWTGAGDSTSVDQFGIRCFLRHKVAARGMESRGGRQAEVG